MKKMPVLIQHTVGLGMWGKTYGWAVYLPIAPYPGLIISTERISEEIKRVWIDLDEGGLIVAQTTGHWANDWDQEYTKKMQAEAEASGWKDLLKARDKVLELLSMEERDDARS